MQAGWLADLAGTQSVAKTIHQQTNKHFTKKHRHQFHNTTATTTIIIRALKI